VETYDEKNRRSKMWRYCPFNGECLFKSKLDKLHPHFCCVFSDTCQLEKKNQFSKRFLYKHPVSDGAERVCVDPGEMGAILGARGPGLPGRGKGGQLASDSGGG
jgi:hypothetical protein